MPTRTSPSTSPLVVSCERTLQGCCTRCGYSSRKICPRGVLTLCVVSGTFVGSFHQTVLAGETPEVVNTNVLTTKWKALVQENENLLDPEYTSGVTRTRNIEKVKLRKHWMIPIP